MCRHRHFDPILEAPGPSGLRLYIGVFDEPGLEQALGHAAASREGCFGIAARDAAAHQNVAGPVVMEERRITSQPVVDDSGGVLGVLHLHDLWKTEMI